MSDQLGQSEQLSTDSPQVLNPGERVFPWPIVDKSLPRPAPTEAYSWSKYNPNAQIHYLTDHNRANSVLSSSVFDGAVLGFDLEWKPNYIKGNPENPVALIQLASHDAIYLVQISSMREFPLVLADILANPSIVKAGVAIQNDALKLYNDCCVTMCNCVDLSLFAKTVDNERWQGKYNSPLGLGRLVESYEYLLLEKGRITRSNWEASLIPAQIEYACNDAHAAYVLYERFAQMKLLLPAPPDSKWFSFNLISGLLRNPDGTDWHPINPLYNSGPPPPPRIPREHKPKDDTNNSATLLEGEEPAPDAQKPSNSRDFKRKFSGRSNSNPHHKDYDTLLFNRDTTLPHTPRFRGPHHPNAIHTSSQRAPPNASNVGSSSHSQVADSNPQVNSAVSAPASRAFDAHANTVPGSNRARHFKRSSATRNNGPSNDPDKQIIFPPSRQFTRPSSEQVDRKSQDEPRSPKPRRPYKPRPKPVSQPGTTT
ncbi:ribonuclease H-like domain-containing protein [Panaeolus papilionaceus]|nr:ribonuclease H-like domain-containing protein [Panaeolus papilionaceus]